MTDIMSGPKCGPLPKREAIREALAYCETWWGGSTIVYSPGGYSAHPTGYASGAALAVGGVQVYHIRRLSDVTGDDRKWTDLAEQEQERAIDRVAAQCE